MRRNDTLSNVGYDDSYTTRNARDACRRVACCIGTPIASQLSSVRSLLGDGHLETCNALTHLLPAVGFFVYGVIRERLLGNGSLASHLTTASAIVTGVTFGVSVIYHIMSTVPHMAALWYELDHVAVAAAAATTLCTDVALTVGGIGTYVHYAYADAILAAAVASASFVLHRTASGCGGEERRPLYASVRARALGLFRMQVGDGERSRLRAASHTAIAFGWCLNAPAALRFETSMFWVWLGGWLLSSFLCCAGFACLHSYILDELFLHTGCRLCAWRRCVLESHALWHILSAAAAVTLAAAREALLSGGSARRSLVSNIPISLSATSTVDI